MYYSTVNYVAVFLFHYTDAGGNCGTSWASVRLSVCMSVLALKGRWLELLTSSNSVEIRSMAGGDHAWTLRLKGQS